MTAAGAVTLYITNDYLHASQEQNLELKRSNPPLDAAMNWLAQFFAVDHNAGRDPPPQDIADPLGVAFNGGPARVGTFLHYMLFGFERVGEASGFTHFGTHNWFEEGAKYLTQTQNEDGSWEGSDGKVVDTAYALLFLSRQPIARSRFR